MNRIAYYWAKLRLWWASSRAKVSKQNMNRIISSTRSASEEITRSYEHFLDRSKEQERCAVALKRIQYRGTLCPILRTELHTDPYLVLPYAAEKLTRFDVEMALTRHRYGDWGARDACDWQINNSRVQNGAGAVRSQYRLLGGGYFYVETDLGVGKTQVFVQEDSLCAQN